MSSEYSNCVVIDGESVEIPKEFVENGVTVSNFLDDDEPRFDRKSRVKKLKYFVLHETCGNTARGCKKRLLKKGYGVHLILAKNGHLSCHGDFVNDVMVHANQLNKTSIGIEVVNPYNPIYAAGDYNTTDAEWWTWIPSKKNTPGVKKLLKRKGWEKVPRKYVVPTDEQMNTIKLIVPWLCRELGIPYKFPTAYLNKKQRKIKGWNRKPRAKPGEGVVAHRDFASHADSRYILEKLIEAKEEEFFEM